MGRLGCHSLALALGDGDGMEGGTSSDYGAPFFYACFVPVRNLHKNLHKN